MHEDKAYCLILCMCKRRFASYQDSQLFSSTVVVPPLEVKLHDEASLETAHSLSNTGTMTHMILVKVGLLTLI